MVRVLPRSARLPPDGLLLASVQGDVHAPQSAPPQPRLHRDRQERRASHDDGALQLRRRRAGLRHRAGRGPRRDHARPPHQRLHHLVLFVDAVELHGGIRLGRPRYRRRELEGLRAQGRPEHVGPRPHLAVEGRPGQGARAPARQCREGLPPAGAGDGRQLQPHARRLPVVGPDEGAGGGRSASRRRLPALAGHPPFDVRKTWMAGTSRP